MINERVGLYKEIENLTKRPLLVYYTSSRIGAVGTIAPDVLDELIEQLDSLPKKAQEIDLMLISNGGDPLAAYRFVSLIRSRVKKFNVIIPYNAYSAATMIALGADKILMGKYGCLGPIDPQIRVTNENGHINAFGYEDVVAFWDFIKTEVGLTEQQHIKDAFMMLGQKVEPVALGYAKRASSLSHTLGKKLLMMHMNEAGEESKSASIVENLNKSYFSHGHSINHEEVADLGLTVEILEEELYALVWKVYQNLLSESQEKKPFEPLGEFLLKEENSSYLEVPNIVNVPQITDQNMFNFVAGNLISNLMAEINKKNKPLKYELSLSFLESPRLASKYIVNGIFLAMRDSNLAFLTSNINVEMGWKKQELNNSKENK